MRCCTSLRQFYEEAGVEDRVRWRRRITFLERSGRRSILQGSRLPAPFHLMPAFFRLRFLPAADRWSIAAALMRMLRSTGPKPDITVAEWLEQNRQTACAIARFWRPVLVSALNEEPERCSARAAFQIFRQGFLAHPRAYEMGVPRVPLRELYDPCVERVRRLGGEVRFRAPVRGVRVERGRVAGVELDDGFLPADRVVSAVPWDAARELLPEPFRGEPFFRRWERFEPSPISAVHLWWDRVVTDLDHAALLDRRLQWMFNKSRDYEREGPGTHMGLVVSASRDWLPLPRRQILAEAEAEVRESFPGAREARVAASAVIKEAKATYSPVPDVDALRPETATPIGGLYLAGDWVQSGWPATMEAAVRSGYLAAEALLAAEGRPERLAAPALPWEAIIGLRDAGEGGYRPEPRMRRNAA